jgi:hypothetical protein
VTTFVPATRHARSHSTFSWWSVVLAAMLSAGVNILALLAGRHLLGIPFMMPVPGSSSVEPLSVMHVALVSAAPALFAAGLLALLGRLTERPLRALLIISAVVLLASFVPDLIVPVDPATRIGLMVMHVFSALAIVGVLTGVRQPQ